MKHLFINSRLPLLAINSCKTVIQARHGGRLSRRSYSDNGNSNGKGGRYPVDSSATARPFSELHFFTAGRTYESYPLKRESAPEQNILKPQQVS